MKTFDFSSVLEDVENLKTRLFLHQLLCALCFSHLYLHHPCLKSSHWPACVPYFRIRHKSTHAHKSQSNTHMQYCLCAIFFFFYHQAKRILNLMLKAWDTQVKHNEALLSAFTSFFLLNQITSCGGSTRGWRAIWRGKKRNIAHWLTVSFCWYFGF